MQLTEWCIASGLAVSSDTLGEECLSPSFSVFLSRSVLPAFVRGLNLPIEALYFSVIPRQTLERAVLSLSQLRSHGFFDLLT